MESFASRLFLHISAQYNVSKIFELETEVKGVFIMLTIIADYMSVKIGRLKLSLVYAETRDHERLGGNAN